ncbi:MAG: LLM class flavin-dependent oxidoreductase, partial [Acidimicrobiia bacterium]
LRALWRADGEPFVGDFYSTAGIDLAPKPARPEGPPIWIGSWGSAAGLRRVARIGDGWLASAYNTTPEQFAEAVGCLRTELVRNGREPDGFPNALATMWFYLTEDQGDAERVFRDRIVPTIHRPEETLRARLPIGSAEAFAEKLAAFDTAGVQRVYVWPVADESRQLELFCERVRPLLR